jgi:hypothetical protein
MKIFMGCELVERGRELPLQLVSMALVREDGQELYVINEECLSAVMRHPWLSVFVVPHLPIRADDAFIFEWDQNHPEYHYVMGMDKLAGLIRDFITEVSDVELWTYLGAYKYVVLCQLFGSMAELPKGVPAQPHDLMWLHEQNPQIVLPPQPINAHHAMEDARWVRDAVARFSFAAEESSPIDNIIEAEIVEMPYA